MPCRRRLVAQKPHTRRTGWVSRPVTHQQCTMTLSSSPTLSSNYQYPAHNAALSAFNGRFLVRSLNTSRGESIRRPSARQTPKSKYPTLPTLHHVSPRGSAPHRGTRSHAGSGVRSRSVGRRAVSPKVWYPLLSLQSNGPLSPILTLCRPTAAIPPTQANPSLTRKPPQ
jgi:hypothetical protein